MKFKTASRRQRDDIAQALALAGYMVSISFDGRQYTLAMEVVA